VILRVCLGDCNRCTRRLIAPDFWKRGASLIGPVASIDGRGFPQWFGRPIPQWMGGVHLAGELVGAGVRPSFHDSQGRESLKARVQNGKS